MHIGILGEPSNFHTVKWATSLKKQGAQVTVFSFDEDKIEGIQTVCIPAVLGSPNNYTYLSYLFSGGRLNRLLKKYKVDLLNPLNITPFGVLGRKSGFSPMVCSAFGADIFEYPSTSEEQKQIYARSWSNVEGGSSFGDGRNSG